jgi:hypothetical protein
VAGWSENSLEAKALERRTVIQNAKPGTQCSGKQKCQSLNVKMNRYNTIYEEIVSRVESEQSHELHACQLLCPLPTGKRSLYSRYKWISVKSTRHCSHQKSFLKLHTGGSVMQYSWKATISISFAFQLFHIHEQPPCRLVENTWYVSLLLY